MRKYNYYKKIDDKIAFRMRPYSEDDKEMINILLDETKKEWQLLNLTYMTSNTIRELFKGNGRGFTWVYEQFLNIINDKKLGSFPESYVKLTQKQSLTNKIIKSQSMYNDMVVVIKEHINHFEKLLNNKSEGKIGDLSWICQIENAENEKIIYMKMKVETNKNFTQASFISIYKLIFPFIYRDMTYPSKKKIKNGEIPIQIPTGISLFLHRETALALDLFAKKEYNKKLNYIYITPLKSMSNIFNTIDIETKDIPDYMYDKITVYSENFNNPKQYINADEFISKLSSLNNLKYNLKYNICDSCNKTVSLHLLKKCKKCKKGKYCSIQCANIIKIKELHKKCL